MLNSNAGVEIPLNEIINEIKGPEFTRDYFISSCSPGEPDAGEAVATTLVAAQFLVSTEVNNNL